ncbi:hypothetical protein ACHAWF_003704 [Thalassiosira exigua]
MTCTQGKFAATADSILNDPDEFLEKEEGRSERSGGGGGAGPLVLSEEHLYRPLPSDGFPKSLLSPPICPNFFDAFLSSALSEEERRLVGFREQTSRPELIERTLLEVAGTVLTAQLAMRYGLASNLAGGTHHAESGRGKGYTILNDLAVAAQLMTWKESYDVEVDGDDDLLMMLYRGGGPVDRVLVVDCDVHQGDGTATFHGPDDLLNGRLFTLDLHASNNYPHPKERCTYDVGLPDGCDDATYLAALTMSLNKALEEVDPQLVLYNAGVDVHASDKLGRLSLSSEGMTMRDGHVIETCLDRDVPVAVVVGGGYDDDVRVLGRRHASVHRVCAKIWRERRMWTAGDQLPRL